MSLSSPTLDPRFDRTWRAGRGSRRRSRIRTTLTLLLLLFLCTAIAGYWYITDSKRVKGMAEAYLSRLIGGPVHVGWASLSIFEGLRLDDVRIEVDGDDAPDSLLFTAKTFQVQYSPRALLLGRIEATRILALDPRVNLVENLDTRLWNFQRLVRINKPMPPGPVLPTKGVILPEIFLRNAQFDYAQIAGGQHSAVGSLAIEGQLTPNEFGVYRFRLQSRGTTQAIGPVAEGQLALGGGTQTLKLREVEFDHDLKTILPAEVRRFWEAHELAGRIDEMRISFVRKPDGGSGFRVETDLADVQLTVRPDEWMSSVAKQNLQSFHGAVAVARYARVISPAEERRLRTSIDPQPARLENVNGRFVFTEAGVAIQDLIGKLEGNRFKLNGEIEGYKADQSARLRIESPPGEDFMLPAEVKYVASMPWPVREAYYKFRPQGSFGFWVEARRAGPAQKPILTGEITLRDATFRFDRFPFPITRAAGKMTIGIDPQTGLDALRVVALRGYGPAKTANANAVFDVAGVLSPLDGTAGVSMVLSGKGLVFDPLLYASMPPGVQRTMRNFDAGQTGKLPVFTADFVADVRRGIGDRLPTVAIAGIDFHDAKIQPKFFPLPLEGVEARIVLHEFDDFLDIERLTARHADGTVDLSGRVSWDQRIPGTKEPLVLTRLAIKAADLPIDADLVAALPPGRRKWADKVNLGGTLDLGGTLFPAGPDTDDVDYDFAVTVRDGTARPAGTTLALESLNLKARLTPGGLSDATLTARRDRSDIAACGTLDWRPASPLLTLNGSAKALVIDEGVIKLLPEHTRASLADLHTTGSADVTVNFAGPIAQVPIAPQSPALPGPGLEKVKPPDYTIVLKPLAMAARPAFVPYALEKLTGTITVTPASIAIADLSGTHGAASVKVKGKLDRVSDVWALDVFAIDVPLDDDLKKALPKRLAELVESLSAKGTISFDLPGLAVRPAARKANETPESDVDFTLALRGAGVSLDAGVPVTDLAGTVDVKGAVRAGKADQFVGTMKLDAFKLAGRDVTKFTAKLGKPSGRDVVRLGDIQAKVAGGEMAGQLDSFDAAGKEPARFALGLVFRDVSVPELTGEIEKPIEGRLAASLALEGAWADPESRRGRGDVRVQGREMYKVPVLFGVMQMANLSLPVTTPFQDAALRYAVDGDKVTFDQIELRAPTLVMRGSGSLDFGTRQVRMNFTTDNPALGGVPIVGDLFRGAGQELMQLRVRGTLEEPKVGASTFNTMTTTIDEVLKGKSQ